MMTICRLISVIVIFSFATVTTSIASATQPGWYFGGGLGSSDPDKGGFDDDDGLKLFGGYNTDGRLAFEGAFVDLGEFDRGALEFEVDGFQFAALYHLSIGEKFSIFGTAGLYFWDADGSGGARNDDGTDVTFGFGAQYDNERWGIRVGWERFDDVEPDDVDMLSVSGVLHIK
jgi:hypothetical protein